MKALAALAAAAIALAFALPGPQDTTPEKEKDDARRIVESLDWMAGHWVGRSGTNRYETVYTSPTRGEIVGASKEFDDRRMVMFDFERIHVTGDSVFMTPWPNGKKSRSFKLTDYDPAKKRLHFENPEHDFPRSFTYTLESTGRLVIRLTGTMNSQDVSFDIVLARLGK